MTIRGIVKVGDETVLENVVFHINQVQGNSQRLGSWSGYFMVPSSKTAGAWKVEESRDNATLVLEDGRTGEFICTNCDISSYDVTIQFKGSGPLR